MFLVDIINSFIYKILNGLVSSPDLLSQLQLRVPPRTLRNYQTFRLTQHRTIYGENSPINRLMRNANKFKGDFFAISNDALKYYLKKYF